MKNLIMLTFFVCCVIIFFVGCENGNIKINVFTSGDTDFFDSGEEYLVQNRRKFNKSR